MTTDTENNVTPLRNPDPFTLRWFASHCEAEAYHFNTLARDLAVRAIQLPSSDFDVVGKEKRKAAEASARQHLIRVETWKAASALARGFADAQKESA